MLSLVEDVIKKMRCEISDKIRKGVNEKQSVKGKRINIGKSVLERLLFDVEIIGGCKVKLPVWSGDFLEYIDLSNISFAGVLWDGEKLGKEIVYKNTNAIINFKEASIIKYRRGFTIGEYTMRCCDFSGTDLLCHYMADIKGISGCNLKNTKFGNSFSENDWAIFSSLLQRGEINFTSFEGLDFSDLKLPLYCAVRSGCNFADSKVTFITSDMHFFSEDERAEFENEYCDRLSDDMFRNCYMDRIGLILSQSTLSETLKNVDKQILSFAKKDC